MQGLNKVMLMGHLGKDPETVLLPDTHLTKCSLATTESYRDEKGHLKSHTEWHSLIIWQKLAEYAAEHLRKGNRVYVEGKLKTRNYKDADGKTVYVTEVVVDKIINLEKPTKPKEEEPFADADTDTHLPF